MKLFQMNVSIEEIHFLVCGSITDFATGQGIPREVLVLVIYGTNNTNFSSVTGRMLRNSSLRVARSLVLCFQADSDSN